MIGIFDSGLGGLSALKEVRRLLPSEDIIYFGDTGRVPYGSRSKETITKYALQDLNFLMSKQVDAVLIACGTISSIAIDTLRDKYPSIPIIGVVDSAAETAAALTKNKKIGVIATASTIGSHSFERKLRSLDQGLEIIQTACPLFVPLVESGFISPDDEVTHLVAERYLLKIKESGADTLILGCTHYPIITESIARVLPGVQIVSSSKEAAVTLSRMIEPKNTEELGKTEYYVSDEPYEFEKIASIFLETKLCDKVTRIDIEKY